MEVGTLTFTLTAIHPRPTVSPRSRAGTTRPAAMIRGMMAAGLSAACTTSQFYGYSGRS